jgi:hypothetical protein
MATTLRDAAMGEPAMAEDTDVTDAPVGPGVDAPAADIPAPQGTDEIDQLLAEFEQATAAPDQTVDQGARQADILAHREGLLGMGMQRLEQTGPSSRGFPKSQPPGRVCREIQDAERQLQAEYASGSGSFEYCDWKSPASLPRAAW